MPYARQLPLPVGKGIFFFTFQTSGSPPLANRLNIITENRHRTSYVYIVNNPFLFATRDGTTAHVFTFRFRETQINAARVRRSRGADIVVVVRIIVSIETRCIVPAERHSFRFQSQRRPSPSLKRYRRLLDAVVIVFTDRTVLDTEPTLVKRPRLKYADVVDDRRPDYVPCSSYALII